MRHYLDNRVEVRVDQLIFTWVNSANTLPTNLGQYDYEITIMS